MRKSFKLMTVLLLMLLTLFGLTSYAVPLDETVYCSWDEVLNEAEIEDLKEEAAEFEKITGYSFRIFAVSTEEKAELDDVSFDGYDGMVAVYNYETGDTALYSLGEASQFFDEELLTGITDNCIGYYEDYGAWGMMYGFISFSESFITGDFGDETETVTAETASGNLQESTASAQVPYTSRVVDKSVKVVDDADIFTDAEEAELSAFINEVIAEVDKDIVIVTNRSDDGKGKPVWAADFYDWNGYGTGENHEGMCLYIDMDPDDRGWWAMQTGPVSMGLYTEAIANEMDDQLYNYMANGHYAEGVKDWVNNVRTLYKTGIPFAPDWYPDLDKQDSFVPTGAGAESKLVDGSGELTEEQKAEILQRINDISSIYGMDIVINISTKSYNLGRSRYSDLYYKYNDVGYGTGNDNNGILVTLWPYSEDAIIVANGRAAEKLTEVNLNRIEKKCGSKAGLDNGAYKAAMQFLDDYEHMLRTGRVPLQLTTWILAVLGGGLGGSMFGGIALDSAKRRMKADLRAATANLYLTGESLRVNHLGGVTDVFLRTKTKRVYNPVTRSESSSSGGGGGSSYSSSYSGSSGTSHSGSGRSF
ncbi:MAG: TPM domain-containing protein [Lachnospiraceae bacterium]|nr:TPM domain-containing protein [Lachnospiraceae bacterium]